MAINQLDSIHSVVNIDKEIFDDLISNQTVYFENLLTIIGIILTIFLVLVTVFNVYISRELLKYDAKKLFEKEQDKLNKKFQEEVYHMGKISEFMMQLNAANFYITSIIPGKQYLALNHCFIALNLAVDLNDNDRIMEVIDFIRASIDLNSEEEYNDTKLAKQLKAKAKRETYDIQKFTSVLDRIPYKTKFINEIVLEKIIEKN